MAVVNVSEVKTFDGILRELRKLEKQLPGSDLSQLVTFNTAYTIVTTAIKDAARDHYFDNPIFIERFTACFARYYFQAVNKMADGSADLAGAWAAMNDKDLTNTMPRSVMLLMGANAHINHDLPLALAEFISNEKTQYSLRDVRKVDRVLLKSGKQILDAFDEPTPRLRRLKRRLQAAYYRPIMYTILYWRVIAWRNYRFIRRQNKTVNLHEKRSIRIANRLLRVGKSLTKLG
jgi:hypothetical protein